MTFDGVETAGNYDAVYQYDPLGDVGTIGYGAGTTVWGANGFTATADGSLHAVGFYAEAPNTAYEVWEGPSTASLSRITSGTLPQMGFHTVTLPTTPAVTSGSAFVVAVKLTNASYTWPLPLEYPVADYSSHATASAGQSFYSSNGSSWTDLTTWDAGANVCLKAYTTSTAPAALASTTQLRLRDGPLQRLEDHRTVGDHHGVRRHGQPDDPLQQGRRRDLVGRRPATARPSPSPARAPTTSSTTRRRRRRPRRSTTPATSTSTPSLR